MPLTPGTRLGPYEILAPIGAGGMGEVYRARDTRLHRDVAIKVSAEHFTERFAGEARAIASLNHLNICTLHDVGPDYLVMEFVDGPTLAERIKRSPMPLEEALAIAKQIADAIEAAHEKGVVHRDLKPANVKITLEGVVKVLDFGLAIAQASASETTDPSISPTLTIRATEAGMILGTAAYMSPEQAHGRKVDRRADIWSFGAVLYEMLTGGQAFHGESVSDTLAAVLKLDPDWDRLPANTPAAIRKLLRRSLTKDRKQRLQAIGEARIVIDESLRGTAPSEEAAPSPATRRPALPWALAGVLAVIAGVALWGWLRPSAPEPRAVVRLTTGLQVASTVGAIALSPDGSRLAFVGGSQRQIYVRMMDQFDARPLAGTQEASFLCFSPDGQSLSYISGPRPGTQLKKIAVAGGPAQILADARSSVGPPFQDWGPDDNILYSDMGTLMRIPAAGGRPQTLASPDAKKGERYYAAPQLLPGGREVLLLILFGTTSHQLATFNLQTGAKKTLLDSVGHARYVTSGPTSNLGHIVYYADGSLMALPFDVSRLEVKGSPVPVVEGVQRAAGTSPFGLWAVSDSGTLVYVPGDAGQLSASTLVWVDRKGAEEPLAAPPRPYLTPRLSPDGGRIAVSLRGEKADAWIYDLARGTLHRFTSDGILGAAAWTPDGKRLISERHIGGGSEIRWTPADGSGPTSVLATVENRIAASTAVSPDGKVVVGFYPASGELWTLPLQENPSPNTKLLPYLDSRSRKGYAQFSPDGHWVAYESDDSGSSGIYVSPYPGPGGKIPISTEGGIRPRWARGGRELFYRNGEKMMSVDIETSPTFRPSKPKVLFEGRYPSSYDVSKDGQRFLMVKQPGAQQAPTDQVNVVLNWFDELRRRVPAGK